MEARAEGSPWIGTFSIFMYKDVTTVLGAGSSDHIEASCTAAITRHADGTASATAVYVYDETRIEGDTQAGSQVIVTTHVPRTGVSYPAYVSVPSFELDGQGGYRVYAAPPSIQVLKTMVTTRQGSTPIKQQYEDQGVCDPNGAEEAQGKLPGGRIVTGLQTHVRPDGVKITFRWTIEDPTLGPPSPQSSSSNNPGGCDPAGTSSTGAGNSINATLTWRGWELCYAGDWRARREQPGGAPAIISSDGKVQITIQVISAGTSSTSAQGTIAQAGAAAGGVQSIAFRPFAAGKLRGQLGIMTLTGSHNTLLVVVIGEGTGEVIIETLIRPGYTPLDLVEAGMAMASIQQAA
jgi:hypothetical protein